MTNKNTQRKNRYTGFPTSPRYMRDITIKPDSSHGSLESKKSLRKKSAQQLRKIEKQLRARFETVADRIATDAELSKRQKFEAIVAAGMQHVLTRQEAVAAASRKLSFRPGINRRPVSKPQILQGSLSSVEVENAERTADADSTGLPSRQVRKQASENFVDDKFDDELDFDGFAASDEVAKKVQVNARVGQQSFRERILAAFDSHCAVTGCDVRETLQAAHIVPYNGRITNSVYNGLCLRADIHALFDDCLINIGPDFVIHVADNLKNSEYWQYNGQSMRRPKVKFVERMKKLIRVRARLVSS